MNKTNFLTLFLHLIKSILTTTSEEYCSGYKNGYNYFKTRLGQGRFSGNTTFSFFTNFNQFDDLLLDCSQTYNITESVVFRPKTSLIIDGKFHLRKIFNQSKIDSIEYLRLGNLKGFDLNSKSFILNSNRFRQKVVVILAPFR